MDWLRSGSTISNKAWGTVDENGASSVPKSEVLIHVKWWVQIGRTCGGVSEVLGTYDDKLSESLEKRSIRIRSDLVKLWVVDGIKKKCIYLRKTIWWDT